MTALHVASTIFFALGMCGILGGWFCCRIAQDSLDRSLAHLANAKEIHDEKCRVHLFGCPRDGDPKGHDDDCVDCATKGAR